MEQSMNALHTLDYTEARGQYAWLSARTPQVSHSNDIERDNNQELL